MLCNLSNLPAIAKPTARRALNIRRGRGAGADKPGWRSEHLMTPFDPAAEAALGNEPDPKLLAALTEALPNLLLVFANSGRLLRANRHLTYMAEYAPSEVSGLTFAHLFQGLLAGARWQELLHTAQQQVISFSATLTTRRGRLIPLQLGMARVDSEGSARIVVSATDLRGQQAAERHLLRQAFFDPLTQLPNRAGFKRQLGLRMGGDFRRSHDPLALALIDITRFRAINDALGHEGGDEVLRLCANRLKGVLGADEILGHMGEDEFAVMLTDVPDEAAARRAGLRLRAVLDEPFLVSGQRLTLNARVGLALLGGHADPASLLRAADSALSAAKELGASAIGVFDQSMRLRSEQRLHLDGELRTAVANKEFILHFQPIVRLEDGDLVGHEALLRWNHPKRGLLSSAEFIGQAERSGIAPALDTVAMQTALAWLERAPAHLYCNVNASALSLRDPQWLASTFELLRAHPKLGGRLRIEITETALLHDASEVQQVLETLIDAGALIVLDDFGTGYSSLSHLQRFPISGIKIDRSFISRVDSSTRDRQIITAIIGLAADLGLSLTAEGVETQAQRSCLLACGCTLAQGWLFGRPAPAPLDQLCADFKQMGVV